jgi:hypothetical protein
LLFFWLLMSSFSAVVYVCAMHGCLILQKDERRRRR